MKQSEQILRQYIRKQIVEVMNTKKTTGDILLESHGYYSQDALLREALAGNIPSQRFEKILDGYFKVLAEQEGSAMLNTIMTMVQKAAQYIKTVSAKALGAVASFVKKVLTAIMVFKQKHPILYWAIIAVLLMIVSAAMSSSAAAQVKDPAGHTMSAEQINQVVGALEKISQASPDPTSPLAMKIGQFQSELIKGRDNANYIVDLSKQGFFKNAFEAATKFMDGTVADLTKSGGKDAAASFIQKLAAIGKTMQITVTGM